jgi:N-carbamoyl-L-amino-acid hydrolase
MRLQDLIEQSAAELGFSNKRMPSGAGHDSQEMAKVAPMGMIFVPSRNGISHSPEEYTSPEGYGERSGSFVEDGAEAG